MKKLALSDEILLTVQQPARYIGGEVNCVMKNPSLVDIRFAMCFPDVYEIGMSHLGIQILYDMFNRRDDVYCERVYSPWMDLDPIMREQKIPLFAVESQDPIKKFDFLGITIQYEMCYTNILQVLELSQIPLHAEDRTEEDPIVIGGGPCTYNPEPIADVYKRQIDASPELRSKKQLIETFIAGINDVDDVMNEWHEYVVEQRDQDLNRIIAEEKLKPEDTRKFMENAFRDGEIKTAGTDIDKLMPPISRFGGGGRAMKKQGVIDKMKGFFEKYFGIGGSSTFVESNHKVVTYDMSEQENLPMVAEPKMPYGE